MSDNTSPLVTAAWSFLVLVVFLLLWEYGPGWVGMPEFVLPPLTRVAEEAVRIWQNERMLWHALNHFAALLDIHGDLEPLQAKATQD